MSNAEHFGNYKDAIQALYQSFGDGQATLSNVAASASSVQLLAANASRKGCSVVNDSDKILYLKFGATATATSYTAAIAPKNADNVPGYYEFPQPCYTGRVDGIWQAGPTGAARITELS